jgi:DNA-binding IscR family transcriptional regulator
MAQSSRFALSLKILTLLASDPDSRHTSAAIAEQLTESAVMVRRCFLLLHKKGLIDQRKGPNGGARLKLPAKQIGLGDIYLTTEEGWLILDDPALVAPLKRARTEALNTLNETTLAQLLKRLKKHSPAPENTDAPPKKGAS